MKRKKQKIKINSRILLMITILILAFLISKSMSKYIIQKKDTHIQESTPFYFESDIAEEETAKEYTIKDWNGTDTRELEFYVCNYLNSLLKTEEEITYTISAKVIDNTEDSVNDEEFIEAFVKDSKGNIQESNKEYILSNLDFNKDNYILCIKPKVDNLEMGRNYQVQLTISATKPYTKDLIANFTLAIARTENRVTLTNSSNNEYVTLNLKIENLDKDVIIKYDNTKLLLDESNYKVSNIEITKQGNISKLVISQKNLIEKMNYEINFIRLEKSTDIAIGTDIIVE